MKLSLILQALLMALPTIVEIEKLFKKENDHAKTKDESKI